ncbi:MULTISPECIES: hypothetical protein [Rufibacter]|uniref:Entericidin n=1 Tax=Rufibacter quisquiliarum TaxID=1549639 RepID=A0A839H155_9BACT|nr:MULTISPECIES: hypothetical protein [Rufibacter]MBA9079631.1 hypothetical protein [Rufibacter quisquiliarum]
MKKTANLLATAFTAAFLFTSCGDSKPTETTGNTVTEDMVDGADGGLDSLNTSEPDSLDTSQQDMTTQTDSAR